MSIIYGNPIITPSSAFRGRGKDPPPPDRRSVKNSPCKSK